MLQELKAMFLVAEEQNFYYLCMQQNNQIL